MPTMLLETMSNELADAVAAAAPAVVQVQGRRRPVSGLVYGEDVVITTARALGGGDGVRVRRHDGAAHDAELAGWDPATGLAVLRVAGLGLAPIAPSERPPRVGHIAVAVGRSWSNAVTASAGLVSVIGGPLATGRHHAIEEVIRTTARMHDGFAGGAFLDTGGRLIGVATAAAIRGLGVVIPSPIAWKTAAAVLEGGRPHRGYLGLAGQAVRLADAQRNPGDPEDALLIVALTPGGPAAGGGLLIGDLLLAFDGQPVRSPEDLLHLLTGERVGRPVPVRVRRGGASLDLMVTIGERPDR